MSFLDVFFEKYPITIIIKIEGKGVKMILDDDSFFCQTSIVEKTNDCAILRFRHDEMDGISFIRKIMKEKELFESKSNPQCSCTFPFQSTFSTFSHLYNVFHKPFLNYPNTIIKCFVKKYSLSQIKQNYRIIKTIIPSLKFSTFLCSIQCLLYYKTVQASFIKLQILHYLPQISGKNKIFSENLIIDCKNKLFSLVDFASQIQKKRKSIQSIYHIYQNYSFLSKFGSLPKEVPTWDVSFSTIPFLINVDNFEYLSKSQQFEKCSMLTLSNEKNCIFFCMSVDQSLSSIMDNFEINLQF